MCRHWWAKSGTDQRDARLLTVLERLLTVEEIAHFRAIVAVKHSMVLTAGKEAVLKALDVVDAIVANLGKSYTHATRKLHSSCSSHSRITLRSTCHSQ